ncbi:LPXTG cell wall anchor domain-containing protein [Streptomyces sp. TRM76323]|uniref:LPXTG cell wall anchor domain-containing protein n=1 Tax=Streptomyces tamarix TaxID=3078565 RepID=A0ABU3QTW4_9ACTN|nr:LPXTG cell wall anchor domain-containing protein [Streptomyces tamarix]MDT9685807.1 LPXTG cell wall anchor domain-containing protein [Streptomyces tamarix]
MRTLSKTTGALVAAAACCLTLAPTAHATNGDNGTVKIHDAETGEELKKNEPKVCAFYLDAFRFDAAQKVTWQIHAWAENDVEKGTAVKNGSITLDGEGHGRTEDMTLPDGQYKLSWNWEGEKGQAKSKVFKSDCPDVAPGPSDTPSGNPSGTPSENPSGTPSQDPSGTPSGNPSGGPSENPGSPATSPSPSVAPGAPAPSGTAPGGTAPTVAPSPSPSEGSSTGDLAETGSGAPVGVLAALAAVLVAGGALLVARRRRVRQH